MTVFPAAKINLGLNIVERRPDGYHNLETVFMPLEGLHDALEVTVMDERFPSSVDCDLKVTNMTIDGDEQKNLVVRAYRLLKEEFPTLPRVHAHLHTGWHGWWQQRLCGHAHPAQHHVRPGAY